MRSFWNLSLLLLLLFVGFPISFTGCSGQLSEEQAEQSADEEDEGPTDDGSSGEE